MGGGGGDEVAAWVGEEMVAKENEMNRGEWMA